MQPGLATFVPRRLMPLHIAYYSATPQCATPVPRDPSNIPNINPEDACRIAQLTFSCRSVAGALYEDVPSQYAAPCSMQQSVCAQCVTFRDPSTWLGDGSVDVEGKSQTTSQARFIQLYWDSDVLCRTRTAVSSTICALHFCSSAKQTMKIG